MMKIKSFLYVAAVVLLFAACSKDTGEEINPDGEKKWVSFKISIPQGSSTTKAEATSVGGANHGDTYAGTANERKITAVRVVLYNSSDEVVYPFDLVAATDGTAAIAGTDVSTAATATNTYFVSTGKEVLTQPYKMAVLINPTSAMLTATAKAAPLTSLEAAATVSVSTFANTTNGVMMSNSQGLVDVPTTALQTSAASAEGAPVSAAVDRSVAKVFVNVPSGGIAVTNSVNGDAVDPASIKWLLDITNKKSFYLRKQAPMITAVGSLPNTAATTGAEVIDNSAAGRLVRYATDPNWIGFNSIPAGDPLLAAEFNMSDETSTNFKTLGWADADGDYVLENTMNAADQFEVETTRILVKMNYVPNGITAGADWISYKGYIFTKAAFLDSFKVAIDSILVGIPATREMIGLPYGFKADMEAIYVANGGDATPGQTYDATAEPTFTAAFVQNNLKFYLGGMSYYKVLIRHFDDSQQPVKMAYGRYGVVRNNLYKIELASVSGPGDPVVVPPDGPDDDDTSFLSAEISVLPWLVRTQSVNL